MRVYLLHCICIHYRAVGVADLQVFVAIWRLHICADVHGGRERHDDVSFHSHQSSLRTQPYQHSPQKGHLTSLSSISFTSPAFLLVDNTFLSDNQIAFDVITRKFVFCSYHMNFYCFCSVWAKHGWPMLHSSTAMGTAPPGLSKTSPSATRKCVGPFQFYDLVSRFSDTSNSH